MDSLDEIKKRIKEYFRYGCTEKLSGKELREVFNIDTVWLFETIIDEKYHINIFTKLIANLLYLEEDYRKNKKDISYFYGVFAYFIGVVYHPPNGEEIAINYLNKAIALTDEEEEKDIYRYLLSLVVKI